MCVTKLLAMILDDRDDLSILSHSEEGLQRLMNALDALCHTKRLTVDIEKTKLWSFHKTEQTLRSHIKASRSKRCKISDLGLDLHQSKSFTFCTSHLLRKALFALGRRCMELHITDARLQCSVFDTLVKPVLSYGCEIWAVQAENKDLKQLEGLHIKFLRSILGLPKRGSSHNIVRAEFGRYPLHVFWWKQVLAYRSRLMDLPQERLLSRAFEINEYITHKSWSAHVDQWLNARAASHARITGSIPDAVYTSQIDSSELILRYKLELEIDMRTHSGSKTATYTSFKHDYTCGDYLSGMANCQLRKTLSKFRCGSHWLRCATRFMSPNTDEQFCPACLEGRVCGEHETEHHAIFECDAYHHIRRIHKFRPLFAGMPTESLHAFHENNNYTLIANSCFNVGEKEPKL